MKEQQEQTLVVNIYLTRGLLALLIPVLLLAALVVGLAWSQDEAVASNPQAPLRSVQDRPLAASTGMRLYYLTPSAVLTAGLALDACANGYHMASLWEILDPSNLKYNTTLGYGAGIHDTGSGPPTWWSGWVRTGYTANSGTTPGQANCTAWTSSSGSGTYISLVDNWTGSKDIHVWTVNTALCANPGHVWCVED
jgi:hypothetical protein